MKVSVALLQRKMPEVFRALDRGETVTLYYRGQKKALLIPAEAEKKNRRPMWEHPAFGMWKDREDMKNVAQYVRGLRKPRYR